MTNSSNADAGRWTVTKEGYALALLDGIPGNVRFRLENNAFACAVFMTQEKGVSR